MENQPQEEKLIPLVEQEADVIRRFSPYPPIPEFDQVTRYHEIRERAKLFGLHLVHQCPNSRERSLAITHLESVVFWAHTAIARNEKKP